MYGVYDRYKEIREAIRAGECALNSLREAERHSNSAGQLEIVEMAE